MNMRLADFIRAEIEPILQDWEAFARTLFHADHMSKAGLRDHARELLLEIADDLDSQQSDAEQSAKSKGLGPVGGEESWAEVHGGDRLSSGFSVMEAVSEFRALRASVVSHWSNTYPEITNEQREDLTRFHEAVDQAVAESLEHYTTEKDMETRLFGAVLSASPDPIFVVDLEGRFSFANKATVELFALEPNAITGKTITDLGFSFASGLECNLETVIADRSIHRGKFVHSFSSGLGERFEYLLAPVLDENQRTEAVVCIFRDITEQVLAEEKIWHSAHHDLLTGLPNRRLFMDRLEQEIKHAKRSKQGLAILFMDLDGFKDVNDSFGHEAGDRLLSDMSERLVRCVREEDTVARLGGDEFTMLITGARQRKDIERLSRNIKDAVEMPFEVAQRSVHVSVSIGVSFFPQDATAPAALLEAADRAMYKTKKTVPYKKDC